MKKVLLLLSVVALSFVVSCGTVEKKREIPPRKITLDELKMHDGTAWVAVNGIVYDVTHNKSWCCGSHHGIKAGQDLSERIKKSPHGTKTLANLPIIGKLDDGTAPKVEEKPAPVPAPVVAPVAPPKEEPKQVVEEEKKTEPQAEPKQEEATEVKAEEKPAEKTEEKAEPKKEEVKKEEPKKEEVKKEEPKKEEVKKEEPKKETPKKEAPKKEEPKK